MSSMSFVIFSVCLLSFANSGPVPDNDEPIKLVVPEACKGKQFCSEVPDNYDQIQERIRKLMPSDMLSDVQERLGIPDEVGLSPKPDWHNCPTRKYTDTPNWAQDPIATEKYDIVVQYGESYKQTIVGVECPASVIKNISSSSENRQCFPDLFPAQTRNIGMKSSCELQYSVRSMYILDLEHNRLIMKPYRIPVHCSCQLMSSMD